MMKFIIKEYKVVIIIWAIFFGLLIVEQGINNYNKSVEQYNKAHMTGKYYSYTNNGIGNELYEIDFSSGNTFKAQQFKVWDNQKNKAVSKYDKAELSGKYKVKDDTVTLDFNNGAKVKAEIEYSNDDKDKESFFVTSANGLKNVIGRKTRFERRDLFDSGFPEAAEYVTGD
ncbi:hypothetical protein [Lactobacillus taiwanensis]|uniref:hypothetical protein n=1 Tax=Lactobacillus taiwanensis TaxID=508451 RepID=UPI001AEC0F9E|nr:hypothetical protein [Lactobacillus taiwanensis]QTQ40046.1 hypothetical protein H1A07_00645 [Lactobacillus taiwanensis]